MSRRSQVDVSGLKALRDRIKRMQEGQWQQGAANIAKECGKQLLTKVKDRTPTGIVPKGISKDAKEKYWGGYSGGTMRDKWSVLPVEQSGPYTTLTIINNVKYASYVENGHRQAAGRYVPAIEKRLKESWVPGKFMLKKSMDEVEAKLPEIAQRELDSILREVF